MLPVALLGLGLVPAVMAIPAAGRMAEPTVCVDRRVAVATPAPTEAVVLGRRDIDDDARSYINRLAAEVPSKISRWVLSGTLDFPSGLPTGGQVKESANISDDDLAAQPTQVLNIPPYGNWTDNGWNVRVHGNVYKDPALDQDKVDELANTFLVDMSVESLSDSEKAQTRNVTRSIFVIQQNNTSRRMNFTHKNGGADDARGGSSNITLTDNTSLHGDFDVFVKLGNTTGYLMPGNETSKIQTLDLYAEGMNNNGNSTAYLVPPKGVTIISDIDDILRVTKIYQPKEGLLNTFARPFSAWMNMPDIYADLSSSINDLHFHYLTTTPEQITRNYMSFIYNTYPLGSFDTRPLNFSDIPATLSIRRFLLDKILQTFPDRKFILVADTSNSDVMEVYPALYKAYPGQVQCIWLRNTSATDGANKFPYDTSGFKNISENSYMFFTVPDDLTRLDVANGQCLNNTVEQNVTFGIQGLQETNAAGGISVRMIVVIIAGIVAVLVAVMV
ncbi:hypothetical protein F66182_8796 [Fusarium sp. NRRL 66182]|nr:hypothetical protein F66182_8796 [Fusarium sp. NRRL 66182]